MAKVIESTFVVPAEETPKEKIRLSNLEQVAQHLYTCSVYLYKNNQTPDFFSIEVIKVALAKALVLFYPLAGRFIIGDDGRRMIDCSAEGVLLVVAWSEHTSDEIKFEPSSELRNDFVPKVPSSSFMTSLQVTYLKCGDVVLGCANNHIFIDGRSAFHFFQTWAQIARGAINSIVSPCFDNTQLHSRSPPIIKFDYPEYESIDQVVNNTGTPVFHVTTKLKLSNEQISSIKSHCIEGSKTSRVSTFCAISALFWKCYCIAQELPPGAETKLQFTADVRARLQPPLHQKFFGNSIIRMSATAEVSKVTSNSIHIAADVVKGTIDRITDEYVRSFMDYIEVNLDKKLSPVKLLKSGLRIANITGMPVYEADFGWGAPQLMTLAEITGTNVISLINKPGDAGITAYVLLDSDSTMHKFEKAYYEELSVLHSIKVDNSIYHAS